MPRSGWVINLVLWLVMLYSREIHNSLTLPTHFQFFPVKHTGKAQLCGNETKYKLEAIKITASDKNQ